MRGLVALFALSLAVLQLAEGSFVEREILDPKPLVRASPSLVEVTAGAGVSWIPKNEGKCKDGMKCPFDNGICCDGGDICCPASHPCTDDEPPRCGESDATYALRIAKAKMQAELFEEDKKAKQKQKQKDEQKFKIAWKAGNKDAALYNQKTKKMQEKMSVSKADLEDYLNKEKTRLAKVTKEEHAAKVHLNRRENLSKMRYRKQEALAKRARAELRMKMERGRKQAAARRHAMFLAERRNKAAARKHQEELAKSLRYPKRPIALKDTTHGLKCLTYTRKAHNTLIRIYPCNRRNIRMRFQWFPDHTIRAAEDKNYCLGAPRISRAQPIRLVRCSGSVNYKWYHPIPRTGVIKNVRNPHYVIDLRGNNRRNGNYVWLWPRHNGSPQQWCTSTSFNCLPRVRGHTLLSPTPVCMNARSATSGRFTVNLRGKYISSFYLKHVRGAVSCNAHSYSKWGCSEGWFNTLIVRERGNQLVAPMRGMRWTSWAGRWYRIPHYSVNSAHLQLLTKNPIYIARPEVFKMVYGEAYTRYTIGDNRGASCAYVFAKLANLPGPRDWIRIARGASFRIQRHHLMKANSQLIRPTGRPQYSVMFWCLLKGPIRSWGNLLHIGNHPTHRNPGIWTYPGRTDLWIRSSSNRGWDTGMYLSRTPRNSWFHLVVNHFTNGYMEVWVNGGRRYRGYLGIHRNFNGHMWISDPWYLPANGYVGDVRFRELPASYGEIRSAYRQRKYNHHIR